MSQCPYSPTKAPDNVFYSLVFHMPKQFPCIKARQLAYKDFEDGDAEGWNSIPESPILQEGDVIRIIRGCSEELRAQQGEQVIR